MIKKYREKGIIRAEQYQGTDEQQRKYGILRMKRSLTERFHDYLFTNYSSSSLSVVEKGKFDIKHSSRSLQYVDQNNRKHNIYFGDNSTVTVDELK